MDKTLLAFSLQTPVQKHATSSMKILLHLTWNSDHPNLQKSLAGLQVVLQDLRGKEQVPAMLVTGSLAFKEPGCMVSESCSKPLCSNLPVL